MMVLNGFCTSQLFFSINNVFIKRVRIPLNQKKSPMVQIVLHLDVTFT